MNKKEIKELIIKYISSFTLERLINIVNFNNEICHCCEHYSWLKPIYKHAFWGCNISTIKFDKHYNCHGNKFEPNQIFLDNLKV